MLVAAFAYASVGHGGASAYIAAMALAGVAPPQMRPIALVLNVLVSAIASYKFYRAGYFGWRLFWPFAVVSVPLAFVGGAILLPGHAYKILVGVVLIYAAWQLWLSARAGDEMRTVREPPLASAMNAYILADRGTWLSFKNRGGLAIAVEGDRRLYNQYGVMLVNAQLHPTVKRDMGQAFVDWLISPDGQAAIAAYKINGEQLFFPNAGS